MNTHNPQQILSVNRLIVVGVTPEPNQIKSNLDKSPLFGKKTHIRSPYTFVRGT